LTRTFGEKAERDEILEHYHIDSFDIPSNRPCQRQRKPTKQFLTAQDRNMEIVKTIGNTTRQGHPVLVLFETIMDTTAFSNILKQHRIEHWVLNDKQKEVKISFCDKQVALQR
jgi:preprotein translocase subunit SecA